MIDDTNTTTTTSNGRNPKNEHGKGLKIASGSITLAILASWFAFAARARFSAAEAIIILLMVISLSFPAKSTLLNSRTIVGELIGLMALLVTELGTCAALLWTFAVLVKKLPVLGTKNVVFFFAPVRLDGWFRYLALVYCAIDAATSVLLARKVVWITVIVWECYRDGRTGEGIQTAIKRIEIILEWEKDGMRSYIHVLRWLTWVLVVLAVELTLHWNRLSPVTDLQAPGQLIPFVAGIVILIDSGFIAGRALLPRCREAVWSWDLRQLVSIRMIRRVQEYFKDIPLKIVGPGQTRA
ncbi:hypothetical protein FQN49_000250 [Arthroderma sp. PD_2]|nr:hypothetical protein FQN49_000250 [Arthroderma sp. PD_2]